MLPLPAEPNSRPSRRLRVVIVEDDDLYRDMLKISLDRHPLLDVVGAFASAEPALDAISELHPEVVVLDVDLGDGMDGVNLGLRLRQQLPRLAVVLLTNQLLPHVLSFLPPDVVAGWSYLHKKTVRDTEALARAIEGAAMQLVVLDEHAVGGREPRPDGLIDHLSPRQRQVLELIVQGYNNAAIAEKLVIAPKSVEHHINQLYRELGIQVAGTTVHPRVQAVLLYLRETALKPA